MIKKEKIRRNNITNEWEHWVDVPPNQGYWAKGLVGLTAKMSDSINNIPTRNPNNELILYQEAENPKYAIAIDILGVDTDKENTLDKEINDLIDSSQIEKLKPVIIKNLTERYGNEITVLTDHLLQFKIDAVNPNPYTDQKYKWNFDKVYFLERDDSITYLNFNSAVEGNLSCKIINPSGITESDSVKITAIEPTLVSFFGRNLVKNGNAKDGMNNWEVITGAPATFPIWRNPTKYGYFNAGHFTVDPPQVDPSFASKWGDTFYFHGGDAEEDNRIVQMIQEIDLNEISDYIDKKIGGVETVTCRLFAWLGAFGYLGGGSGGNDWRSNAWGEGWYYPCIQKTWDGAKFVTSDSYATIHDQVRIEAEFLDENGEILRTERIEVDDTNHLQKVSLKCKTMSVPVFSRSIKLRLFFEKDLTNGVHYYRRHWEEYNKFSFDHLSMATNINLILDVNGRTDKYTNKFLNDRFIGETIYNEDPTILPLPETLGVYNPAPPLETHGEVDVPVANFEADVVEGDIYLFVNFKSLSTNSYTHWWDFGDGYSSTITNPTHTYKRVGVFTVSLYTRNLDESLQSHEIKKDYIKTTLPDLDGQANLKRLEKQEEFINKTEINPNSNGGQQAAE